MNPDLEPLTPEPQQPYQLLVGRLRSVLAAVPLEQQRQTIQSLADELGVDLAQCAAGLLHLLQPNANPPPEPPAQAANPKPPLKMIRYRLDIGSHHQLSLEQLKKTLVEESGVDKNNINNISIRSTYTLIDLPDAMPQDIFQHLKTVEINQRKLEIKRVKSRKKRHNAYLRSKASNNNHDNATPEANTQHTQTRV